MNIFEPLIWYGRKVEWLYNTCVCECLWWDAMGWKTAAAIFVFAATIRSHTYTHFHFAYLNCKKTKRLKSNNNINDESYRHLIGTASRMYTLILKPMHQVHVCIFLFNPLNWPWHHTLAWYYSSLLIF